MYTRGWHGDVPNRYCLVKPFRLTPRHDTVLELIHAVERRAAHRRAKALRVRAALAVELEEQEIGRAHV